MILLNVPEGDRAIRGVECGLTLEQSAMVVAVGGEEICRQSAKVLRRSSFTVYRPRRKQDAGNGGWKSVH